MDQVKGDRCGVDNCRATQYYLEDGLWFCRNGHRKEGRVQIKEEDEVPGTQGRRSKKQTQETQPEQSGSQAKQGVGLYLECLHWVLERQLSWLIKERGLPEEIESIAQNLWSLRLQEVSTKITNDAANGAVEKDVLKAAEDDKSDDGKPKKTKKLGERAPRLIETLCLCYMATLQLRLSISLGDFHRWAIQDEIVFIRAIRIVPSKMKKQLRPELHKALDHSRSFLELDDLHMATSELIRFYKADRGLSFPAINMPLMLSRYIKELALPLYLYPAVKNIMRLLEPFDLSYQLQGRLQRALFPEARLMSLFMIAVKLSQSLDSAESRPRTDSEPAAEVVDWKVWQEVHGPSSKKKKGSIPLGEEIKVKEEDVFQMNGAQMDHYLDWYQRMWIDDSKASISRSLLDLFPLRPVKKQEESPNESTRDDEVTETVRLVASASKFPVPIPDENPEIQSKGGPPTIKRPWSGYRRHRDENELGPETHALLVTAAKLIGVQLKTLMEAIYMLERKLQDWKKKDDKARGVDELNRRGKGPKTVVTPASGESGESDEELEGSSTGNAVDEGQLEPVDRLDDEQMEF